VVYCTKFSPSSQCCTVYICLSDSIVPSLSPLSLFVSSPDRSAHLGENVNTLLKKKATKTFAILRATYHPKKITWAFKNSANSEISRPFWLPLATTALFSSRKDRPMNLYIINKFMGFEVIYSPRNAMHSQLFFAQCYCYLWSRVNCCIHNTLFFT
jgi:hypothetical protein